MILRIAGADILIMFSLLILNLEPSNMKAIKVHFFAFSYTRIKTNLDASTWSKALLSRLVSRAKSQAALKEIFFFEARALNT